MKEILHHLVSLKNWNYSYWGCLGWFKISSIHSREGIFRYTTLQTRMKASYNWDLLHLVANNTAPSS